MTMLYALADQIFLSTPSGWRATALQAAPDWCGRDFYPRPPGGGRRSFGFDILDQDVISIHALRVEGDTFSMIVLSVALNFYPRPPGGGRPGIGRRYQRFYEISIHALRVEGDSSKRTAPPDAPNFYPRPPGGGRPDMSPRKRGAVEFLSTPSGWRATGVACCDSQCGPISIHALRVEGDAFDSVRHLLTPSISIHALRVEGDS